MKYIAEINIMPHRELLDPQGKTVAKNLHHVDIMDVSDVRIGKHITLTVDAADEDAARQQVEAACKKVLANLIMESYDYTLKQTS